MYEFKLRNILRQVKSQNPQKRYEALGQLFEYKQVEGLEVQIDLLKDMIKTAASKFPERVDHHWDNPSYFLIDFVCDFSRPEITEGLIRHFDSFDIQAKERAIDFLILTEDEEIFYFLEEKIVQLIKANDFIIPYRQLAPYPALLKGILDASLDMLQSQRYKFSTYDMLLSLNASGYEKGYQQDVILPALLEDYQAEKWEYLKFDPDYTTKYVYTAWKDSYFIVRNRMRLFMNLMEYYFTPEVEKELLQALKFRDPFLKTEALLICIAKRLPYNESTLIECAQHIETAEMLYWKLKNQSLEHLYPIQESKQPHLAMTRLFTTIINLPEEEGGLVHYPENIQVQHKLEMENYFGQPVRYYLMSFDEHDCMYAGWVGAYALEDGDDTAVLWNDSYTDYVEFDSAPIEKHKQDFFKERAKEKQNYDSSVYFQSSPKLSRGAWFFIALAIIHWIREILTGFEEISLFISILFTVVGCALCYFQFYKNKKRKVLIIGQQLVKQDGAKQQSIGIHEIKKVEYDKKNVLIFNKKNELAFKFPIRWVRYELFYMYMKEHSGHLKNRPFIQG